jgi:uncharacterized FAD-dependent dehydrogenase
MARKKINIAVSPETAFNEILLEAKIRETLHVAPADELNTILLRRSVDARSRQIKINLEADVFINETAPSNLSCTFDFKDVTGKSPVIIVGAGPAGLFAGLKLLELGLKPVIIEQGKNVQSRRRDLAAINKDHIVNPTSNYCFGEGGAGTYSDGKLYTRSNKRGDVHRILELLVHHGAPLDILIDAHPHIGTNRLPKLVSNIRETILASGGEVHFEKKVDDFVLIDNEIKGVITTDGLKYEGIGVILATGHSARDIFELLYRKNILIEQKPFAIGVRIEHPQELIDKIQYHGTPRGEYLPAAPYALVAQTLFGNKQRGVFSFCMCPGGFIVPAATAQGEVVVNGMSPSKRDSRFANSGIVVSVEEEDLLPFRKYGPLAGLVMQKELEQRACVLAGGTQRAPAQRMMDFMDNKVSASLLETSYVPGLASVSMDKVLSDDFSNRLRQAFKIYGEKMKGYLTNDAQLVGVESRTSSPVRIPRNKTTLEHLQIKRLFPCAEGAGYAGGIVSAAMDGEACAEKLATMYGL